MDFWIILIGFLLVVTGAVFFGYPIGFIMGRRADEPEVWFEFEARPHHPPCRCWAENRDVLNAEFIEEVKK